MCLTKIITDGQRMMRFYVIGEGAQQWRRLGSSIDVADLIWKGARMSGFSLFAQPPHGVAAAWQEITPLIVGGSIKPVVERTYPLEGAAEALRYLIEVRPFGKVVLKLEA
jgi:NADPH2:quinone reductase